LFVSFKACEKKDSLHADFSMRAIRILQPHQCPPGVPMKPRALIPVEVTLMNSDSPAPMSSYDREKFNEPSSRLTDEKISDDNGTETKTDSALAPAGLKNPFWSRERRAG
jgi:hypothetical protein